MRNKTVKSGINYHVQKRQRSFTLFFRLFLVSAMMLASPRLRAQSVEQLNQALEKAGFENIRTMSHGKKIIVALENNVFRWDAFALSLALDSIAEFATEQEEIQLIVLRENIPQYILVTPVKSWKEFRFGRKEHSQMMKELIVTWESREVWEKLKRLPVTNRAAGKIELIAYPHLAYENTQLDQLYESQLNLSPLVNISLWKGGNFSGQVIFPLHNELGYSGDFIRPGYVTISQKLRLAERWLATFSAGNFSNNRYGTHLKISRPFSRENWVFEMDLGFTGSSHFYDNQWFNSPLNTFTGRGSLSWFYSRFNLVFTGGAARYIYGDHGLFGQLTRYFGETSVALYFQVNENNKNGGFRVTMPFPFKKRFNRGNLNITIPKHIEMSYNAGTELYYGQNFYTNPSSNTIKNVKFITLIKKDILNQKK